MLKKPISLALLTLLMVAFLLSSLSWAEESSTKNKQGWLGIYLQDLTPDLKESMDIDESVAGVLISGVVEDSPAEKAGIEDRDVIISFDGKKVYSVNNLTSLVKKTEPDSKVKVTILRDGDKIILAVTVGEIKSPGWSGEKAEIYTKLKKGEKGPLTFALLSRPRLGILIQGLNDQLGEYFGVSDGEGVLITEVIAESPAEEAGLKAGDVILEIDNQKVEDTDDLREAISDKEKGDSVEIRLLRNKSPRTFTLTLKEDEWSKEFSEGMEKLKILPEKLEKIEIPEIDIHREYSSEDKNISRELKELKKELEKLKEELEELREEKR